MSNDERALIMTGDDEYSEGMKDKADDVLKSLDRAGKLIREKSYKANVEEIKENFKAYWDLNQQVMQTYASSLKKRNRSISERKEH